MVNTRSHNPATGEWNDSLIGDFLWSNVNTSEAIPDVMTPSTWSLWQYYYVHTNPVRLPDRYPFCGNIAGRPYLNLSLAISLYRSVGKDIRREMHGDIIGSIQEVPDIPLIPFPPLAALWMVLPGMLKAKRFASRHAQMVTDFPISNPVWCRSMQQQVCLTSDRAALLSAWQEEIRPRFMDACSMLRSVTMRFTEPATRLRLALEKLAGEVDTGTILSNFDTGEKSLESLGPLVGLARVVSGKLSREAYMERYGHRGPHELELFAPGAEDDPDWLDRKLADFRRSPVDVDALLAEQRDRSRQAWEHLERQYPRKAARLRRQHEVVAAAARRREAVRSEVTRLTRLIRRFCLHAGEVTGLGDGIFFLSLEEMTDVLSGQEAPVDAIPARRETYQKYTALPPYPPIIIGRFDPFAWAADPNKRSDYFDARTPAPAPAAATITGFAGAAGCVEGTVRRIDTPEEGDLLQPGEILVTVTTNVGWSPLFPRAAAIVTDVGAPLSHAAIVARELGIPAVVGCGDATTRLTTGDRVHVDGGAGTVTIVKE